MGRILILGSEGFIGKNLTDNFAKTNNKVSGCDLYEAGHSPAYDYFKVTRLSPDWEDIFSSRRFDFCINAAGSGNVPYSMTHPVSDFEANTLDTIRILDTLKRLNPECKYLHISSAAVYGNPKDLPVKETDNLQPLSPYGYHKLLSELLCQEYFTIYGLRTAIIRPFSVYGEGLQKQLFWDVCSKLKKSDSIQLYGTGNESRDYLHVKDLSKLVQIIIEQSNFSANIYNAASGTESSLEKVAELFVNNYKVSKKISFSGQNRPGDPLNWKADISQIKALGFTPTVPLDSGIAGYIRWFQSI